MKLIQIERSSLRKFANPAASWREGEFGGPHLRNRPRSPGSVTYTVRFLGHLGPNVALLSSQHLCKEAQYRLSIDL